MLTVAEVGVVVEVGVVLTEMPSSWVSLGDAAGGGLLVAVEVEVDGALVVDVGVERMVPWLLHWIVSTTVTTTALVVTVEGKVTTTTLYPSSPRFPIAPTAVGAAWVAGLVQLP